MNGSSYVQVLELAAGAVLVCALVALWRRDLRTVVSVLAVQGIALATVAGTLALHERDVSLGVIAAVVLAAKAGLIPLLLRQIVRRDPASRESAPLVNVPASLVAGAALIIVAFVATGKIGAIAPGPAVNLAPIGTATALVGFFLLVTRRKAVSQIVGLLLIDNGIALLAFLLTSGVPFLVELGASLDVLLVVVVLRVLASTMQLHRGSFDLDELRELHD